jgi:hypothetical protein
MVNKRFGSPLTESPIGELTLLRRDVPADDFAKSFMALLCRGTAITEAHRVQLFLTGLRNPLRIDVAVANHTQQCRHAVTCLRTTRRGVFINTTTTLVVGTATTAILISATSICNTTDPYSYFGGVGLIGGQAGVQYTSPIAGRDHTMTQGWAMLPL